MKIIRKVFNSVLNLLLTLIVYPVHHYFIQLKFRQAKAEVEYLLSEIDCRSGCLTAEAKMMRIEHLREHYRIPYQALGDHTLTGYIDLRCRVNSSLARVESHEQRVRESFATATKITSTIPPAEKSQPVIRIC